MMKWIYIMKIMKKSKKNKYSKIKIYYSFLISIFINCFMNMNCYYYIYIFFGTKFYLIFSYTYLIHNFHFENHSL